jgi:hypothetical protein
MNKYKRDINYLININQLLLKHEFYNNVTLLLSFGIRCTFVY